MLTDDGSPLTIELAQTLTQRGWQVVVMSFPQCSSPESSLSSKIPRIVLENGDEVHLEQQLKAIAEQYGSIAAAIHLHPLLQNREEEHMMLKQVFFLAKHLTRQLNEASQQGDSCFLTVAHLDGELGWSGCQNSEITGGLFGLSKALRWEWQSVYCRAIDLSTELDTATSIQSIIAELHDPNRLLGEVGYSTKGRTTLVC